MPRYSLAGFFLVLPGLALIAALFLYPLGFSLLSAFTQDGAFTLAHFAKAFELYSGDIEFTLFIVILSTLFIALASVLIAGLLTLSETPWLVAILRNLYRWPLFIP